MNPMRASAGTRAVHVAACAVGLLGAAMLTGAAQADGDEVESFRVRDARRQHVELARRADLRAAWLAADDGARAAAGAVLAAMRDPDAAPGSPPSLRATSEALRLLRGRPPAELVALQRFADALALEPRPGAFEARAEDGGPGELTIVRVYPLWEAHAPPDEFVVNLWWLGPDGEELRARGEPVLHTALALPGFEMYLRPPASAPGPWSMVAEVGYEGERVRGVPVAVECVADLAARVASLEGTEGLLARDVLDVLARGVPLPPGASVGAWLDHVAHGAASERAGDVVPRTLDGLPVAWELVTDVERPRRALVLVDAFSEPPRGWFDVPGKRGWLDAARALEARVLAIPAPLDDAALAALRDQLADGEGGELLLVARGAAVPDVLVRRAALESLVHGLVLETGLGSRSAPPPLALPALVLDAGAGEDAEQDVVREGRAPLRWVRRRAPPILADLDLPDLVAAWWSGAAGSAGEEPGDVGDGDGR